MLGQDTFILEEDGDGQRQEDLIPPITLRVCNGRVLPANTRGHFVQYRWHRWQDEIESRGSAPLLNLPEREGAP